MKEEWRVIKGFPLYQISNMGRVKTEKQLLKTSKNNHGYCRVSLYNAGVMKSCRVHRLVLSAFVGESDLAVNHKNAIKTDNRLINLEYCTNKHNSLHAKEMGLIASGVNHPSRKLTAKEYESIRAEYIVKSQRKSNAKELAKKYRVSTFTIRKVARSANLKLGVVNGL